MNFSPLSMGGMSKKNIPNFSINFLPSFLPLIAQKKIQVTITLRMIMKNVIHQDEIIMMIMMITGPSGYIFGEGAGRGRPDVVIFGVHWRGPALLDMIVWHGRVPPRHFWVPACLRTHSGVVGQYFDPPRPKILPTSIQKVSKKFWCPAGPGPGRHFGPKSEKLLNMMVFMD